MDDLIVGSNDFVLRSSCCPFATAAAAVAVLDTATAETEAVAVSDPAAVETGLAVLRLGHHVLHGPHHLAYLLPCSSHNPKELQQELRYRRFFT